MFVLACVASVSVGLGSKESQRNMIFGVLPAQKMVHWKNTEKPVPRSFFAPKPHGNACYAGYVCPLENKGLSRARVARCSPEMAVGRIHPTLFAVSLREMLLSRDPKLINVSAIRDSSVLIYILSLQSFWVTSKAGEKKGKRLREDIFQIKVPLRKGLTRETKQLGKG